MPEKNMPRPSRELIRGGDITKIAQTGFVGNIPLVAIRELENEATGVMHGSVMLTIHIKDGNLVSRHN